MSIYGNILILGLFLIILFGLCIFAVNILVNRLIQWQESVNNQLKESADTAVAAGQAKSQFLAQMSHEIRTPINAIIGMNEMILRECRDASILKYSNNVAQASDILISLINDILDFSKIESGKMELIEENYTLDELIKNLINMIKPRAAKKNLDFTVKVNENIPNELFGDSMRIRQIVVNLLTNAVKYTQVGGIIFDVDMKEISSDEVILKFRVKDTGIGIKEEDKLKLFKDFERFDSKNNKNIEGTGLGLAITSKLVNMMNGKIDVESKYGEGSTFTVILPQKIIGTDLIGNFEEKTKSPKTNQNNYAVDFIAPDAKVLVVDDNEMNLLVVTNLLKATKIQVETAISGMVALKKLSENHYDIIFLDQMMPSLDGIQTFKLAKDMKDNKSKDSPVIALTANAISGAREMFLKEGFTNYLAKPIDVKLLEEMLVEYLPIEKIKAPPEETDNKTENADNKNIKPLDSYEYLNPALGLQYSAGMDDMYRNVLTMFCNLKEGKKEKIEEAFKNKDWNNYTTFVHALKSTSLSIGGEKLSESAKQLETSGKILISPSSSELEKHEAVEYIKAHNAEVIELYDKLVEEGRDYLNGESGSNKSESEIQNEKIENDSTSTVEENNNDDDLTFMLELQDAFEKEDWSKYAALIQGIKNSDNFSLLKQIDISCKMINSEFTTDKEKEDAVNFVKSHHAEIIEL